MTTDERRRIVISGDDWPEPRGGRPVGDAQRRRLWEYCARFVREQRIACPEAIEQCDRVLENAAEFIAGVAEIVGYAAGDDTRGEA